MTPRTLMATLVFAASAVSLAPACKTTCDSGDMQCFLENLVIVEPVEDGEPMELVPVGGSKIKKGPSVECPSGQLACSSKCIDTTEDKANCGDCGHACPSAAVCKGGSCQCPSGMTECAGTCVNTANDQYHCGGCNLSCVGMGSCWQGQCYGGCPQGLANCNGTCAELFADPTNCGECGVVCAAGQECVSGGCACPPGDALCNGECVYTGGDERHCGGCGKACSAGQICDGALCQCPGGNPNCTGGGGTELPPPALPTIQGEVPPVTFGEPSELIPVAIQFTDPFKCTPSMCLMLCNSGDCTAGFMCTRPKKDNLTSGTWRSYLGFLAEPAATPAQFTTEMTAVSGEGCDEDLPDLIESGDVEAAASNVISFDVTVEVQVTDDGSSGGGASCSGYLTGCQNCAIDACATSGGECWYETSDGAVFDCAPGCSCVGAAEQVVAYCCPPPS